MIDEKTIENLFKIAVNVKPKPHIKNGNTRAQNLDVVSRGATELQMLAIAYRCLSAAVKLSDDNKAISAEAEALITHELEKIGNNV